jgi:hypothetical protein
MSATRCEWDDGAVMPLAGCMAFRSRPAAGSGGLLHLPPAGVEVPA